MANKRTLKHGINLICGELITECIAASLYGPTAHKDNAESLIYSILKMQADYTSRISHPEPGMPSKLYYRDLREKFTAQIGEVIDQINSL